MLFSSYIKRRASKFDKKIEHFENKVESNKACKKIGVRVPKLYYVLDKVDDLKKCVLNDNCIIKFNNLACSKGIIMRKNGSFIKYKNIEEVIKYLKIHENQKQVGQISIRNIPRKLMVEELLIPSDKILYDIKCFCFYGKVKYVHIINPEKRNECFMFDEQGNRVYIYTRDLAYKHVDFVKPKFYNQIISEANKVAHHYFKEYALRIDFYSTHNGPVFGEFTFNPSAGNGLSHEGDTLMGKLLKE